MSPRPPRLRTGAALIVVLCALVVAGAAPSPVLAAGTGEFCGPGWQRVTIPGVYPVNRLHDLDGVAADLWAVGTTFGGAKPQVPLVERWDGSSWSASILQPSTTASELNGVARLGSADVWAVGRGQGGGATRALAMHWRGASWTQTSMPALPSSPVLSAVDGSSST